MPCEEITCILYPMCINKKEIDCAHLRKYFKELMKRKDNDEYWKELCKTLPQLVSIIGFTIERDDIAISYGRRQ